MSAEYAPNPNLIQENLFDVNIPNPRNIPKSVDGMYVLRSCRRLRWACSDRSWAFSRFLCRLRATAQRVLSTHMGNTYPNHKGHYYYRNHTLYHIGVLWTLWAGLQSRAEGYCKEAKTKSPGCAEKLPCAFVSWVPLPNPPTPLWYTPWSRLNLRQQGGRRVGGP